MAGIVGTVFITLIIAFSIFGIVYVWISTRNKERMALIEKGADASLFTSKKKSFSNITLKFGMLATGVGLGILIGNILVEYTRLNEAVAFLSMIFIFGGAGLIINALIERKANKDD